MIKKEFFALLCFLISLPGCFGTCKKSNCKKSKKVAQGHDIFSQVGIPLAHDGDMSMDDETVRSFFDDDMQDFMTFAHEDDFELEQAGPQERAGQYSWLNADANAGQLETAYFDFDRHTISKAERAKAKKNAQKIKDKITEDKEVTVVVEGHACASAGSAAYNLALSGKRAKSYADFLQSEGVPADRIKKVGRGKEMLVVKEGGREEQWPNRRVELHELHDNVVAPAA